MKNMTRIILFCVAASATSVIYGAQEATGVYGVDVVVKEKPILRAVTDPNGNFALGSLRPGSYTLSFRARRAKDLGGNLTNDQVMVATSYSINIEGTKKALRRAGLSADKLLAGVDIAVEVGAAATLRGRVLPTEKKQWVWVPHRTGSNVPGHWAEKGSEEASPQNSLVLAPGDWAGIRPP